MMRTLPPWLDLVADTLRRTEGGARARTVVETLAAFSEPDAPSPSATDWGGLDGWAARACLRLQEEIPRRLAGEVDAAQAAMFGRRFGSLATFLAQIAEEHTEAKAYRIGLAVRADGILARGERCATRIRALVDYLYSHGSILTYRDRSDARTVEQLAAEAGFRPVGPGLEHARAVGMTPHGPAHVNVLAVSPERRLRCLDARGVAGMVSLVTREGALAAVSGGFFLYSEPDIRPPSVRGDPVGGLISNGQVIGPPIFERGTVWQRTDGAFGVGVMGPVGASLLDQRGRRVAITQVNPAHPTPGALYNRAGGERAPAGARYVSVVGGHSVLTTDRTIPLAGALVQLPESIRQWDGPVRWELGDSEVRDAMMGGPMLVQGSQVCCRFPAEQFAGTAPPVTFSQDETFDQNLLPRMAAGLRDDGALVFAAVDGRNLQRALGFTLNMTGRFMRALGCASVTNLDGGSSKRMVVDGAVVDLPSTELRVGDQSSPPVRPVHTAILIE